MPDLTPCKVCDDPTAPEGFGITAAGGQKTTCLQCEAAQNRAHSRRHRAQNKAKVSAYNIAYHERRRDELNERHRQWYQDNREHALVYQSSYCRTSRARTLNVIRLGRRRAIMRGTRDEDVSRYVWMVRLKRLVTCHICGKRLSGKRCHIDHIVPLARGGTHTISNLAPACPACNVRKSATMPEFWQPTLEDAAYV